MKLTVEIKELDSKQLKVEVSDKPEGFKDATYVELIAYSVFLAYIDSMWEETQAKAHTPERAKSIEHLAKIFIDFLEEGGDPKTAAKIVPGQMSDSDKEAIVSTMVEAIAMKNKFAKKKQN